MKKLSIIMVVLGMWLGLTGCNTLKGAGRDIERAGEAVQDSVK